MELQFLSVFFFFFKWRTAPSVGDDRKWARINSK